MRSATAPVSRTEIDQVLAFIGAEQADAARASACLGATPDVLAAALAALPQPWQQTVRVVRDGERIVGASLVTWDAEAGRARVFGPWVAGDDDAWEAHAGVLLDAALAQVPEGITEHEVCAEVSNVRLATLASGRGWRSTDPHHVYVLTRDTARAWGDADHARVRAATVADIPVVQLMHEAEFPSTYATARHLIADPATITLVVEDADGNALGYASGHVAPGGTGHLDYMAVHPDARGLGDGSRLLEAAARAVLDRSRTGTVCLAVESHRRPAITLYEARGFVRKLTVQLFRSSAERAPEPRSAPGVGRPRG